MKLVEVVEGECKIIEPSPIQKKSQHWGVTLGCISVFISMAGATFTFPFMQSQRDSLGINHLNYYCNNSYYIELSIISISNFNFRM